MLQRVPGHFGDSFGAAPGTSGTELRPAGGHWTTVPSQRSEPFAQSQPLVALCAQRGVRGASGLRHLQLLEPKQIGVPIHTLICLIYIYMTYTDT